MTIKHASNTPTIRIARAADLPDIMKIYNQGIETRLATMESETKDMDHMKQWYHNRNPRYQVIVLEDDKKQVIGWASLSPFSHRSCYAGIAEISIYLENGSQGKGYGKILMQGLEAVAKKNHFHKLVLSTFADNIPGQRLYKSSGFREVGTYYKQGILDGQWMDVTIMEKLLI